ncbi:DUF2249 domain-containing protein [Zeimonas arvi]|uniref:DUF2249 domain-containing protein n=1 Tax=Zeimonas arvi TaxID=2498847 RepID=A0A5C8NYM7_9BURK|nr:DUF2249 domain-containing protein [Zeimonas arvi]TXL66246.1 DUF2249 domain-containing protein [Zeimonas arvi]
MSTATATLDVRTIPPRERHVRIFSTFQHLPVDGSIELVNDHDPVPLHDQFLALLPGGFSWDYLETGPDLWRVRIGKLGGSSCCGSCGG